MSTRAASLHAPVAFGVFGADMQVALVNEGPVTFWLQAKPGENGAVATD
jgi:D-tyrosyl-tRNA(Tyr) deacylase